MRNFPRNKKRFFFFQIHLQDVIFLFLFSRYPNNKYYLKISFIISYLWNERLDIHNDIGRKFMKIISLTLIVGSSKHFSIPNSLVIVAIIVFKLPCIYTFSILPIIPMREINKISSKRIHINWLTLYSCN